MGRSFAEGGGAIYGQRTGEQLTVSVSELPFSSVSLWFCVPNLSAILWDSDSPYYYPDGSLRVTLEARLAVRKLWEMFS